MRSFIAALRTLVLPWGATSGSRIVLNGVQGRIEVYSQTGDLLMTLDDDGFVVYDPTPDIRQIIGSTTDFATHTFFDTDGGYGLTLGYQAIPLGDDHRSFFIQSPDTDKGFLRFFLHSPKGTNTKEPMMQFDTGFIDSAVTAQPVVDLTGFTGALAAKTVMADPAIGVSNGAGNTPTISRSLGRGVVAYAQSTGNISIPANASPTAYFDGQIASNVPVEAGRRYRVTASGWFDWVTGGSGHAIGDLFWFRIQVDEGAGYIPLTKEGFQQFRTNVAVVGRWPVVPIIGYYDATADGTPDFKYSAKKQAGATTVTMVVTENGGLQPGTLLIEDIGETP